PGGWHDAPIVHLGPVAHEIAGEFGRLFPGALLGLTAQGFLRTWGDGSVVQPGRWSGDNALLDTCDVVFFSEEDLRGDDRFLQQCIETVPIVALTRGARGVTLFWEGRHEQFPAAEAREVDPTGAGDVFAAAFLIEYNLTRDPRHSAAFACCAASFAVESTGLLGIPDRRAAEGRLSTYPADMGRTANARPPAGGDTGGIPESI
ncbi:MAG TPA: PfkB family carbohydrate kinase, partial [Chloroflexota bacterium]